MKELGGIVLGVVPSVSAVGWALVRLTPYDEAVLGLGVIRARAAREAGPLALHEGTRDMANALGDVMRRAPIVAIAGCAPNERPSQDVSRTTARPRASARRAPTWCPAGECCMSESGQGSV